MYKHNLSAKPVTDEAILLRPGLVKIVVSRTDEVTGETVEFPLPVQWTQQEVGLQWAKELRNQNDKILHTF